MKLKAYLSGGMEYADNHGADWRNEIEIWLQNELGHDSFNPVKASEEFLLRNYPNIDFRLLKTTDLSLHKKIASEIVKLDSTEIILKSDYVICYYDESAQKGAGTKGELTVAAIFGKPVYLVSGLSLQNIPSWVIGCSTDILNSFEELKTFLKKHFL